MPFGKIPRSVILNEEKKRERKIVKRVVKTVNKGREHKVFTNIYNQLQVPWNGNFYELCNPVVGTADTQRIGDRVTPVNIDLKLRIVSSSSDVYNMVRIIVIQAHTTAFVVATDILRVMSSLSAPYAPESQFNYDNRKTYSVLYDRLRGVSYNVGPATTTFNINIKRKLRPIQFTGGTVTTISGGLYMIVISDSQATVHPDLAGTVRVLYTDS